MCKKLREKQYCNIIIQQRKMPMAAKNFVVSLKASNSPVASNRVRVEA